MLVSKLSDLRGGVLRSDGLLFRQQPIPDSLPLRSGSMISRLPLRIHPHCGSLLNDVIENQRIHKLLANIAADTGLKVMPIYTWTPYDQKR
jgi:hypothetical protein